jgi:hypothetical protein
MSLLTIEVSIDHGRVTPTEPATLPEIGRGLLTILPESAPTVPGGLPPFHHWLENARGCAAIGVTTDRIMATTRGED